jgi:hypothetical protein
MIHITEQTPTLLIIRSKRGVMAIGMTLFVLFSIFTMGMIFVYGIPMLINNFAWWRLLAYLVWQPLSIALVVVGILLWNTSMRGLTLTFDRTTEQVTLRKPRLLRMQSHSYPIYSIRRMEMERVPQAQVFTVYLVTQSGEHLTIATVSQFDEKPTRDMIKSVRDFLHGT